MREHVDAQRVQHADRRRPGQVLRQARQRKPRHPGQGHAQGQPLHGRVIDAPAIIRPGQAMVDQLADQPRP